MMKTDKSKFLKLQTIGPKYLVMKRIKSKETLVNVSPFLIKKVIDSLCGSEVELCKKLRSGDILIKSKSFTQAAKLITLTALSPTIEVEVTEHSTLNYTKGVVFSYDLKKIDEEEILEELKPQNICGVKKILKRDTDKTLKETGLMIITFSSITLPEEINIGYEKVKVRPYIPLPLRCKNCLRFGHLSAACKNNKTCPDCAKNFHIDEEEDETCSFEKSCINCKDNGLENCKHAAYDKTCPIFLKEKEIQAIITLEKVDRKKATETYKKRHQENSNFASTMNDVTSVQNKITNEPNTQPIAEKTSPRELINYSDINPTTSEKPPEAKKKVVILPRNTSNKAKLAVKRQTTRSNKQQSTSTKVKTTEEEESDEEAMALD